MSIHRESQRNITRARTKISQIRIINTWTLVKNTHIKHACTLFYLHDEINFDRALIHVITRKFSQRTESIYRTQHNARTVTIYKITFIAHRLLHKSSPFTSNKTSHKNIHYETHNKLYTHLYSPEHNHHSYNRIIRRTNFSSANRRFSSLNYLSAFQINRVRAHHSLNWPTLHKN